MSTTIYSRTAMVAVAATMFALPPASAAEAEEAGKAAESAEGVAAAKPQPNFYSMMRCLRAADVEVLTPRTEAWTPAEEGHYYPFGTAVRARAAVGEAASADKEQGLFALGLESSIALYAGGEFVLCAPAKDDAAACRVLKLVAGRMALNLPRTLPDGLVSVQAPSFTCENLAGESSFAFQPVAEGQEVVVRCVTGALAIKGRHFDIPRMGAANQVRVRTTGDELFTSLRGESGICDVILDQGMGVEKNFETGEVKDVPKTLKFSLSPLCAVKIFRAVSGVGGRMVVSTMTFDPTGEMKNRCAFAEGLSNVNSGELVVAKVVADGKDAKKKADAAEAEETVDSEDDGAARKKVEKKEDSEAAEDSDAEDTKKDAKKGKDKEEDSDI